jgi:aspartate kinase
MSLIIQKFGGSSLADAAHIQKISEIIARNYNAGDDVVVVLSAQGDTTDFLIHKAKEIDPECSGRELDALLSTGEQVSIALTALCLQKKGYPAISLTGWQSGIHTNSSYGSATITRIDTSIIEAHLSQHRIVVIAGFQGVDVEDNITTLGRGGSDTTAVALAAYLKADICQFYKDVDGVYTTDPHRDASAEKIKEISYDNMLKLIHSGAQVLHDQSVILAKQYGISLEVRSSFTGAPGTIINK